MLEGPLILIMLLLWVVSVYAGPPIGLAALIVLYARRRDATGREVAARLGCFNLALGLAMAAVVLAMTLNEGNSVGSIGGGLFIMCAPSLVPGLIAFVLARRGVREAAQPGGHVAGVLAPVAFAVLAGAFAAKILGSLMF